MAAAVAAGRARKITVERSRLRHDQIAALVEVARAGGAAVELVETVEGIAQSANAQGVVLDATPIPLFSVDDLSRPDAAILILDHLEDPHNVGAAARSAWAAGMTGLVVAERRAAPLGPAAFKAGAGAFEHVPVAIVSSIADAISRLKQREIWTVGLAADADESLFGLALLAEPVAVVIGGEGRGLGRLAAERVDLNVSIPMADGVESLNASIAAALAAFEISRMRASATEVSI